MANIKVKRSAVPGKVPLVGDLALGEFAVNTHDGKVYTKKSVDGVETIVTVNPDGTALENLQSRYSYTISGSAQDTFAANYTVPYVDVYQNGSRLATGDYTATDGSSVVLAVAAQPGDVVEIVALNSYTANSDFLNVPTGIATADFLKFDVAATNTPEVAKLNWNADDGTLEFGLKGGQVVLQVGQEQVQRIYNNTGNTLVSGQVVYVTGSQGNRLTVALASASSESTSTRTFGVVTETILNEAEGFIATSGLVRGLDTSAFAEGSVLWLGTSAGTYTTTKPAAPNHGVLVGFVVRQHASVGSVFVHIANGYELNELHDVLISSKQDGQALVYEAATGLWKNKFVDYDTLLNKPTLVTQTDINNAIAALVDTAPATLDTLNELAAALGDDPNFATTITNSLAGKQATLVSGTNIKTVNGTSILGSGNIQIDGGVTSFNTRTGAVTLSSSDVTAALGYTPYNSTNPSGYITSSASITGNAATATALQTARTINGVSFDGSANITVADSTKLPLAGGTMTGAITFAAAQTWPTFNQSTTGNAATATALQTARTINGVSFNGTANITITSNTTNTLTRGSYLTGSNFDGSAATTWAVDATSANTASKVVARDASGNFSAGTITAQGLTVSNANTVVQPEIRSTVAAASGYDKVTLGLVANSGVANTRKFEFGVIYFANLAAPAGFIGVPQANGTARYLWVDDNGKLRSDTNVTSVGGTGGTVFLDSGNYNSYALPLSGGTVTGNITTTSRVIVGSGQNSSWLEMADTDEGTRYLHNNSSTIGFVANDGNWSFRIQDAGNMWLRNRGWFDDIVMRKDITQTMFSGQSSALAFENQSSFFRFAFNDVRFYDWNNGTDIFGLDDHAWSSTSMRAPIFYDRNDTNYYLDPNSNSRLNRIDPNEIYNYGWFRNWYTNYGFYNQANGTHLYSNGTASWAITGSGGNVELQFRANHQSTIRGYVYGDTSNNFGLLNQNGSWKVRVNGGDTEIYDYTYTNDLRTYIMYDRNDTGYYVDPNSTSNLNTAYAWTMRARNLYFYGVGGDSGASADGYSIYQEAGAWTHPYPDLVIGYHTGIKIGGYYGYNGTRFYNNNPASGSLIASIGDGDNALRSYDNIIAYASDRRLKENIVKIDNAVDKVLKLNGVTFDWKDMVKDLGFEPSSKHEAGVLAQEVQAVLPEAVEIAPFDYDWKKPNKSKSGESYLTVKYEKLVPLLIEAIKEQQQQIEELKKKVNSV